MTCDRNFIGCDGHLYCTPDTWTARHCYVCIYPLENQSDTGAARDRCGLGCQDCLDWPDDQLAFKQKLFRTGKRFLRPSRGLSGRNAHGRLADLVTNIPMPVPRRVQYQRAPCWTNDGDECFGTICDCDGSEGYNPSPSPEEAEAVCHTPAGDVGPGELLPGRLRDCRGYTGWEWLPPSEINRTIDCRHIVHEQGPSTVVLSTGELCEPVNHRMMGCCANMMVLALAKIASSDCRSGYQCFVDDPLLPGHPLGFLYYADGDVGAESRALWDVMQFQNNATFLHAPSEQASDKLLVDSKNYTLQALKTWTPFHTLGNTVPSSGNHNVGLYRKELDLSGQPVTNFPVIMPILVGLRHANTYASGHLRLYKAHIELKLIVIPIMVGTPLTSTVEKWEPYVRVRMRMWTYIDAPSFSAMIIRDWKPADDPARVTSVLFNRAFVGGLPTVYPPIDDVVITDINGTPFIPPRMVEWRGWRGNFSFPKTEPIFQGDYNSSNQSNDLRKLISGTSNLSGRLTSSYLSIPGWSDQHEQSPAAPIKTYGGDVRIGFAL